MKTQVNYLNAVRALISENRQLFNDWDIVVQYNLSRGGLDINVLAYRWLLEYYKSAQHRSAKRAS
jgi:hypothetical protein